MLTQNGQKNSGAAILRSKLCKQFSLITGRQNPNCTTRQRMKIKCKDEHESQGEKTHEIFKILMPAASAETIIILEFQIENSQNNCNKQNNGIVK